jgi:hypothetical protein
VTYAIMHYISQEFESLGHPVLQGKGTMHPLISIFEKKGLVGGDQIERAILTEWSIAQIETFFEELYDATAAAESDVQKTATDDNPLTAFNFVSSFSLSGAGGCPALSCRTERAQLVARYAALYADRVIVPMNLLNPRHYQRPQNSEREADLRYELAGTLLIIHEMRPAIEADLISVITPELHFCQDCAAKALERIGRIRRAAQELAVETRKEFSMSFLGSQPFPHFKVNGPTEYCEHGGFVRISREFPRWLPKSYHSKVAVSLPPTILRRSRIVEQVFRNIAREVVLQEFFSDRYNAKTLTSNPGELVLLSELNPDRSRYSRIEASLSRITHVIPLMGEVSLAKAVRIRKQEPDSFLVYRRALSEVFKESLQSGEVLTERRASAIVSDILEPELAKLRELSRDTRTNATKKAALRLAFAGAILALGFFRGLLPAEFSALGSAAAISGLVESLGELRVSSTATRNQNFHFLLRLTQ